MEFQQENEEGFQHIFNDCDEDNGIENHGTEDTNVAPDPHLLNSPEIEDDKKRSGVWPEFLVIGGAAYADGKRRATCRHCKIASFIAESKYETTNMKRHLDKCKSYQVVKALRINSDDDRPFEQKVYRELVAKAIIRHGYSFSWVEYEGNREIHTYLNKHVVPISRNTAKSDCLKMHAYMKNQLKKTLMSLPGRICLTCDLWTSCQTEGYLCLTAHYVDSNWRLNSKVLNFCHPELPHTGSVLCNIVFDLLQEWDIQHKLFSITLDNASSNDKMQDELKLKLNDKRLLLCSGEYFHIRCAAHTLNLIVKDGLKAIDDCIVKVRESVKYVKGSEFRKKLFQQCVKRAMVRHTKALWLDVPTRWNSTYLMLDRALLYRRAFKELSRIDHSYNTFPTDDEWERIAKIHELLAPFCDITDMFSGSCYPTANLYFENVWKIDMFLKEQYHTYDPVINGMVGQMREKFDKYWSDYNTLFAFAVVLDPRCKLAFLRFCYKKLYGDDEMAYFKVNDIRFKLEMLLREYTKRTTPGPRPSSTQLPSNNANEQNLETPPRKRKLDYTAEFDETDVFHMEKSMLDTYLEDPKLERKIELNILDFWREKEEKYHELSHLARDILSVPLTTVASESTFSIGGRILNKWKSSYIPENVEALITTRSWLYGFEANGVEEFTGSYVDWTCAKCK